MKSNAIPNSMRQKIKKPFSSSSRVSVSSNSCLSLTRPALPFRSSWPCMKSSGVVIGGVTRGGIGGAIPREPYHYGAPNHCGYAEKSQHCHNYFLQCSTFAPKSLRFEHGGAKLASCPGHHLTSLRPWWWLRNKCTTKTFFSAIQKYSTESLNLNI